MHRVYYGDISSASRNLNCKVNGIEDKNSKVTTTSGLVIKVLKNVRRLRNKVWDNKGDGAFAQVTHRFFRMQLSLMRVRQVFHFLLRNSFDVH